MSVIGDLMGQVKQPNDRPDETRPADPDIRPLDASVEREGGGWRIRLPLRAEQVRVEKESFVAEQVVVRKRTRLEHATVDETVRREELATDPDSGPSYDATEPIRRTRRGYKPPYQV